MSIRTRYSEHVSQMTFGDVGSLGLGVIIGEGVGIAVAADILQEVNHSSVYDSLQDRITELSHQNASLSQVTKDQILNGYRGKAAVEGFIQHRIKANDSKIATLQAEQPKQLDDGSVIGVVVGMSMVGAVAGAAVAYGSKKAIQAARARFKMPDETNA